MMTVVCIDQYAQRCPDSWHWRDTDSDKDSDKDIIYWHPNPTTPPHPTPPHSILFGRFDSSTCKECI